LRDLAFEKGQNYAFLESGIKQLLGGEVLDGENRTGGCYAQPRPALGRYKTHLSGSI